MQLCNIEKEKENWKGTFKSSLHQHWFILNRKENENQHIESTFSIWIFVVNEKLT